MAGFCSFSLLALSVCLLLGSSFADDPYVNFEFEVSYITASPLGVPQQVYFFLSSFSPFCYNGLVCNVVFVNGFALFY